MTSLPVIANISRVVSRVIDRLTSDRSDYPLLVCLCVKQALEFFSIRSQICYGKAAWVEILENHAVQWAGCWGDNVYFWIGTEHGEIIDLNASVNFKKNAHAKPDQKALQSPPILWSREIPKFYSYKMEGVAEIELLDPRDQKWLKQALLEITEKCHPDKITEDEEFPNEPILCNNRRLLDDTKESFKLFDRTLAVSGIPELPPELR